jgi:hypothetical protein
MHSCVHAWTMHVLNQDTDMELVRLALKCVALHSRGKKKQTSGGLRSDVTLLIQGAIFKAYKTR